MSKNNKPEQERWFRIVYFVILGILVVYVATYGWLAIRTYELYVQISSLQSELNEFQEWYDNLSEEERQEFIESGKYGELCEEVQDGAEKIEEAIKKYQERQRTSQLRSTLYSIFLSVIIVAILWRVKTRILKKPQNS